MFHSCFRQRLHNVKHNECVTALFAAFVLKTLLYKSVIPLAYLRAIGKAKQAQLTPGPQPPLNNTTKNLKIGSSRDLRSRHCCCGGKQGGIRTVSMATRLPIIHPRTSQNKKNGMSESKEKWRGGCPEARPQLCRPRGRPVSRYQA